MTLRSPIRGLLTATAVVGLAASAQALTYNAGDLLLGFQVTGGTGVNTTYMVNLGAGTSFRDAGSNSINLLNIGTGLSTAFGADWYDRTDLYWGIIGVRQNGYSAVSPGVVSGDTRSTIYASQVRNDFGTQSSAINNPGGSTLDSPATSIMGLNTTFINAGSNAIDKSGVNTWEDYTTPGQGQNFGFLGSSMIGTFGASTMTGSATYEGALDLYRMNRRNLDTGSHAGNVIVPGVDEGDGSFEGTFAIRSNGQIDYLAPIPEPGSVLLSAIGLGAVALMRRRRQAAA